jgi:hypothetical protein
MSTFNANNFAAAHNKSNQRKLNAASRLAKAYNVILNNKNREKLARALFNNMKLNNNISARVQSASAVINLKVPRRMFTRKPVRFRQYLANLKPLGNSNYSRALNLIGQIINTNNRKQAQSILSNVMRNKPESLKLYIAMLHEAILNQHSSPQ